MQTEKAQYRLSEGKGARSLPNLATGAEAEQQEPIRHHDKRNCE
jgi:hypothetical protein